MKLPVTVVIPTYNEEKNVGRAVSSVAPFVNQVLIVDSWSNDATLQVASSVATHVDVISVKFTTFANKMNVGLGSDLIRNEWVMRLDADEVVVEPESFFSSVRRALDNPSEELVGLYVQRRYVFLGSWVKNGGMYPRKVLRIFKKGRARFEEKGVDEKMILDGNADSLSIDIADDCQKGFTHWARKHVQYAKREARDSIHIGKNSQQYDLAFDNDTQEHKKKYYRLPLFVRPMLYFAHRFLLQKGVYDGPRGWLYHLLHALIYRELVDYYILKNRLLGTSGA